MTKTGCCALCRKIKIIQDRPLTAGGGYPLLLCGDVNCKCHKVNTRVELTSERGVEEWEKEFDEKFGIAGSSGTYQGIRDHGIKAFIHHQLQKARQDILALVLEVGSKGNVGDKTYGHAINEVYSTIQDRYHSELDQEVGITSEDKNLADLT